jgi:exosortase A-associated hydrolase 1
VIAREAPLCFYCKGETLVGIVHLPDKPTRRGMIIVVGGPQYRVGSHREFVLVARALAAAGIPILRFDYRGMGDSDGDFQGFEAIDDDITAAIDAFTTYLPELDQVVLWGLCDAASAILFYAHRDNRVGGVIALNPWVHTEAGMAVAYLKHYYIRRLLEPQFWQKIWRGDFDLRGAMSSFSSLLKTALGKDGPSDDPAQPATTGTLAATRSDCPQLAARVAEGVARFDGPVMLILSGNDLIAREFEDVVAAYERLRILLQTKRVTLHRLPAADHTFSRREWRDRVVVWTQDWVLSL